MTRVTSVCSLSAWTMYQLTCVTACDTMRSAQSAKQVASIYGPRANLCHENVWWSTKRKRISTLPCLTRTWTPLLMRSHWGVVRPEFDDAFGPWASLVIMSAFALALARPCDLNHIFPVLNVNVVIISTTAGRVSCDKMIFLLSNLSILSDLVRGPTTWSNEDPFHTTNETLILHHVLVGFFLSFVHQLPKERASSSNTFTLVLTRC